MGQRRLPGEASAFLRLDSAWNSYETAGYVGYYTVRKNKVMLEYLDGEYHGQYIRKFALFKKDTLIFKHTSLNPASFKMEATYDTLVADRYPIK